MTYGEDVLYHELAVLGATYNWSLSEALDFEHATRQRFLRAASELGLGT